MNQNEQFNDSLTLQIVQAISTMFEMRDPYTHRHQIRTARLAMAIGNRLDLSKEQVHLIYLAAKVHDIGKYRIPTEILCKPGKLEEVEYNLIKIHPVWGYEILNKIEHLETVAQIVLQHHERLNGSGYPYGIQGDQILFESKILGVADVVESIMSHRPYRPALGKEKAIQEIRSNRDVLYDSKVVNECIIILQHPD